MPRDEMSKGYYSDDGGAFTPSCFNQGLFFMVIEQKTLQYGHSVTAGGMTCLSEAKGVTCRRGEERAEHRRIRQQHAHVTRAVIRKPAAQHPGQQRRIDEMIGPGAKFAFEPDPAVVDLDQRSEQIGDRRGVRRRDRSVHAGVAASSAPMARTEAVAEPNANSLCLARKK